MNAVAWIPRRRDWLRRCAVVAVLPAMLRWMVVANALAAPPIPVFAADSDTIVTDDWQPGDPGVPGSYYLDSGTMIPPDVGVPWDDAWTPADCPPPTYSVWLTRLGLRHSYTHGRNVGWGQPLVGTSWMNRPYYVGATLGPIWMTRSLADSVSRDTDAIGTVLCGWDWDYYWGSEFQYAYASPELTNAAAPNAPRNDRMAHWNYSLMYYPWGDAAIRPYWRLGVGNTKFDFPTEAGIRHDEWLLTFPLGVGVKYPLRRWLAARAEFADHISVGDNGVASQHNLALTFGLECHFGAHPPSYWPWNPSRHIW